MGRMTSHILWKIKHVPNHQRVVYTCPSFYPVNMVHGTSTILDLSQATWTSSQQLEPGNIFKSTLLSTSVLQSHPMVRSCSPQQKTVTDLTGWGFQSLPHHPIISSLETMVKRFFGGIKNTSVRPCGTHRMGLCHI